MSTDVPRMAEAFDGRVERLRRHVQEIGLAERCDFEEFRADLQSVQAEFDAAGLIALAQILERVGMLVEVWDCLAVDDPRSARDIADFCNRGLGELSLVCSPNGTGGDGDLDWILEESKARWGQYLGLFDEEYSLPGSERPVDELVFDDEPAAIDSASLLRMLMGSAAEELTPPAPMKSAPAIQPIAKAAREAKPLLAPAPPPEARREFPAPPRSIEMDPELREAFLAEATDLFERIEALVLSLGGSTDPSEALDELGRCLHTLKGAAGSVGLLELAALVHSLEEHLDGPSGAATPGLIDRFFGGLKYLEGLLVVLRQGPSASTLAIDSAPGLSPKCVDQPPPVAQRAAPIETRREEHGPAPSAAEGPLRVPSAKVDDLMDIASELITRRGLWINQADAMKDFATQAKGCRSRLIASIDRFHDLGLSREGGDVLAPTSRGTQADFPWLLRRLSEQAEDLAVLTDTAQAAALVLSDQRDAITRLTLQLWESLQSIRITPVRGLFQRLARVAHDAARVEGRQVEVVMAGEENGLDRAVQDKVFEPMLHVIRNAVGHGIEGVADRVKAGKPVAGRVTLGARSEGNALVLTVSDDGRGLDYAAIEAKGRRLGLLVANEPASLNRLNALIFQSGFSTREEANSISGRGVGMDVVSQEVARLHGTIDLTSQTGLGTTLTIRLPVRLALEQLMIVRIDGQALALPLALVDLAQPFEPGEQEGWGAEATVRVRGEQVRLIVARDALGFSTTPPASNPKLLLVRAHDDSLALLVDAIDGTRELVLRPLGPLLAGHPLISGTGFLASGEPVLALNPAGLSRWLRVGGIPGLVLSKKSAVRQAPILVVDDSISVRKVVTRNLRSLGYEVEEVSHGLEALGRLRNHTYSMILTDLEMPQLDGFELLAELARSRSLASLPVVVASTKCDPETRRRVLELGARAFLSKPVEPETLARVIRPLLDPPVTTATSSPDRSTNEARTESRIHLIEGTPWKAR
ncbi:response regulator [Singulisphaera sp. Ch08]|uniref:histidine kinase n=1 Tax=Singulisphaera sp. Ch08 TaxID=3120278 RepID=A0AAU7CAQ5_9BACT